MISIHQMEDTSRLDSITERQINFMNLNNFTSLILFFIKIYQL